MEDWRDGATVVVRGHKPKGAVARMTGSVPGKNAYDLAVEGGGYTVYFLAGPEPTCPGLIEVHGKLFTVRGSPGSKAEGETVLQVDATSARCL